jgi:hypothetical protein
MRSCAPTPAACLLTLAAPSALSQGAPAASLDTAHSRALKAIAAVPR